MGTCFDRCDVTSVKLDSAFNRCKQETSKNVMRLCLGFLLVDGKRCVNQNGEELGVIRGFKRQSKWRIGCEYPCLLKYFICMQVSLWIFREWVFAMVKFFRPLHLIKSWTPSPPPPHTPPMRINFCISPWTLHYSTFILIFTKVLYLDLQKISAGNNFQPNRKWRRFFVCSLLLSLETPNDVQSVA